MVRSQPYFRIEKETWREVSEKASHGSEWGIHVQSKEGYKPNSGEKPMAQKALNAEGPLADISAVLPTYRPGPSRFQNAPLAFSASFLCPNQESRVQCFGLVHTGSTA